MSINREKLKERFDKRQEERVLGLPYQFYTPKGGEGSRVRFISHPETGDSYFETMKHHNPSPDIMSVICPKAKDDELGVRNVCPICDLVNVFREAGETDRISDLRAKSRFYFVLFDLDELKSITDEELENVGSLIYVMEKGPRMFDTFCEYALDADYGDITSLDDGITFKLKKTGSGRMTKTSLIPDPKAKPALPEALQTQAQERFPNLDSHVYPTMSAREIFYLLSENDRGLLEEGGKSAEDYPDVSIYDLIMGNNEEEEEPVEEEPVEEEVEKEVPVDESPPVNPKKQSSAKKIGKKASKDEAIQKFKDRLRKLEGKKGSK